MHSTNYQHVNLPFKADDLRLHLPRTLTNEVQVFCSLGVHSSIIIIISVILYILFFFRDIFSALADGPTCRLLQSLLVETVRTKHPDVEAIVGLEARGFLFSFSIAAELGIPCLPVRKKGKLPGEVFSYQYDLEYGSVSMTIVPYRIRCSLPGWNLVSQILWGSWIFLESISILV